MLRAARERAAATCMQACWRMHVARRRLVAARNAVVHVQSALRRWQARTRCDVRNAAAQLSSAAWDSPPAGSSWSVLRRACSGLKGLCQLSCCEAHTSSRCDCVRLQAHGAKTLPPEPEPLFALCRYMQLRAATITLQAAWRARQARQLLRHHRAARRLQAAARGWLARRRLAASRAAATSIQVCRSRQSTCT